MSRKQLFICDLLQRREIGRLHRNEQHQLTEASTGLADKLLVQNNVIKVRIKNFDFFILRVITKWQLLMVNASFLPSLSLISIISFFHQPQTIPCIDDRSRSSYMAVTNTKGIAAMTHSNRCISLIDTGTMKRIAEIDGLTRTVWTLCFHPHDPNLLATGDLGGTVCVFYGTVCDTPNKFDLQRLISQSSLILSLQTKIQSRLNDSYPITSISFHAKEPLIFYSIDNRIVIWNYETDAKITDLFAMEESRIK